MPELPDQSLYGQAMSDHERGIYDRAQHEPGLDGEVALTRLQVFLLLQSRMTRTNPATLQLNMRAIELIIKALRARGAGADAGQSTLEKELERMAASIQERVGEP
jgi:hypothetical protein